MHVQPPEGAPRSALSEHRSIPELMRSVVDGLTRLFRQEVALAKIEVTEAISERAFGIGAFALGGVFITLVVVYLAAAGVAALDLVMPAWGSRL
ncbi:MAG TPA: phage holin family protein, partial [Actinomycetota bacterium]|nr:phage holin family protein [Actinomycetota bacterium]